MYSKQLWHGVKDKNQQNVIICSSSNNNANTTYLVFHLIKDITTWAQEHFVKVLLVNTLYFELGALLLFTSEPDLTQLM